MNARQVCEAKIVRSARSREAQSKGVMYGICRPGAYCQKAMLRESRHIQQLPLGQNVPQ